ncbi:MAG: Bax inhibitor-1 family protein [Candidatus Heimdallarchaeota archaeon]|nr:Bax inhibitor-1 family protein [Candidatus Heimdallarchaeota archaeon]
MSYYYYQPQYQEQLNKSIQNQVIEKLTFGLIAAAAISAFVVITDLSYVFALLAIVLEVIAIIGYYFARNEATIETLYYIFVGSSATLLGFTLESILAVVPNGMLVITYAFGATALIVGFTNYKAQTTRPDLNRLGSNLFKFGLLFILIMIIGIFINFGGFTYFLLSIFGAILFSFYLYYDLNRLMRGHLSSPARMAWSLYWDILLIFKFILRILLSMVSDR